MCCRMHLLGLKRVLGMVPLPSDFRDGICLQDLEIVRLTLNWCFGTNSGKCALKDG